ncbi:MAG: phosphotransferase [Planctomycetota bacterium]
MRASQDSMPYLLELATRVAKARAAAPPPPWLPSSAKEFLLQPLRSGGAAAVFRSPQQPPEALGLVPASNTAIGAVDLVRLVPEGDARLPGAALVSNREYLEGELAPVIGRFESVHLVSYHPERRAVYRVQGWWDNAPRVVFLKLLARSAFERALATLRRLPAASCSIHLITPILWLEPEAAHVTPTAPGECLHSRLMRGDAPPIDRLAGLLRSIRGIPVTTPMRPHTLSDERDVTVRWLKRACILRPELAPLLELVHAVRDPAGDSASSFLHRDLHDKQIFVDGEELAIIDLDGIGLGHALIDAVNLAEHLRLRSLQEPTLCGHLATASRDLLRLLDIDIHDPLVCYLQGLTRARLAGVYAHRPLSHDLAETLAREATSILEDLA